MGMVEALGTKGRLAYPKTYFLQIAKETLYRCNRNSQSFLWIEVPFKISDRNNLSLHSLLSEEHIGIFGQGDGCLWCLYRNKDLQFLEDIKAKIISDIKEIEFIRDIGLESSALSFDSKVYFYSGKPQMHFHEEDRFIKNWNKENDFFKIKRISIEHINEKTFKGTYVRFTKRLIDIAGSIFGLLIFSWVMLICTICVKFALLRWKAEQKKQGDFKDYDSSIIFKQIRVGQNGKLFKCYKFRTMYPGADKKKEELRKQQEADGIKRGPTFKMDNDPRILKFGGSFLRKHSLDELPQFFNVFKGDMSLVGPRPPTPDEVKTYESWHYIRLSVKPGLTCIWQTSGRSNLDFDEWMRLDNKYIRERSTLKDLNLKIKTVEVMISGKGAS
ncbi:MAG: sugar transferase [Fibromonadaceae bacterium]|jgi:lipopolysaccharide/colanic/teichoic acid biosynthesis glycosyltransferase|nr:sugar transferase [Fibromonadaceae bacterium]